MRDLGQLSRKCTCTATTQQFARPAKQFVGQIAGCSTHPGAQRSGLPDLPHFGEKAALHRTQATQLGDLAAAHETHASHAGPAALVCAPVTAESLSAVLKEIEEASRLGAEVVELRLDYQTDLDLDNPGPQIQEQLSACKKAGLPAIITLRPKWEGGRFEGPEPVRLAILKFASTLEPAYIDIELLAADFFFSGAGTVPIGTNVILSHHDYNSTPTDKELDDLAAKMVESGADIAKIAATANDVSDSIRMLRFAERTEGPVIALTMGERGLPARLLASKFGGHLTFGCLSQEQGSAPGQPTVQQLLQMYQVSRQKPSTQVFGVVGNPVAHSRSPALHNAALQAAGINAVYIPFLVDNFESFLSSFNGSDFRGFSVTIPHKLAALKAADEVDEVAEQIGAVNTLVRQPNGTLKGYNTDWSAAITAVEATLRDNPDEDCDPEGCSLDFGSWDEENPQGGPADDGTSTSESPLKGKRVVVVGSGGAGRALAFGAASRGAEVVVANRNRQKAEALVEALGGTAEVAGLDDLAAGRVTGYVLMNSTSVGMQPDTDATPVPKSALAAYRLVFDAVYTPLETRLLREAQESGCLTVSGLEMFIGQAAQQFKLFTGEEAPLGLMRDTMLKKL